ncbi:tripartite tricarboxylate transporter substrate binding protein [Roseixanthobacter glucoisosaccharinicivorans]|uniref:tripartite tricarboxylate transporter substrate binding protein n=1 Tax=Roseixanthobacter glucoisosaccharinicivorans TaxID=3119923 RepID=UPI003726A14F
MKTQLLLAAALSLASASAASAWEPTKPIEFLVPFAAGGASDQMVRVMQGIIQKQGLTSQPVVVVNKPAAAGGEAMLELQASSGDAYKLMAGWSGIYLIPLTTKLQVSWRDFTPVALMAQDAFLLWVGEKSPYKTPADFIAAAKDAKPALKVGGAGSKREDHLLAIAMEQAAGIKLNYIPYAGGGAASTQLAGGHIEANFNNPSEDVANWRGGLTRPLCVFSTKRMPYQAKVTATMSWADIPTCPEMGLDVTYQMLRGIFLPKDVTPEQLAFYVNLFKKVSESQEWKDYVTQNALVPDFRTGAEFLEFLKADDQKHQDLVTKAGFRIAN